MMHRHLASAATVVAFALFALGSSKPKSDDAPTTSPTTNAATTAAAAAPPKPVTFAPLAIKNSGAAVKDLLIDAPDSTKYEEKFTNTTVTAGDQFQLMISNAKMDPKENKKTYAGPDSLMKIAKYDVDAPDALLYEGEWLGASGYHVEVNVKVGPTFFTCQDWRKTDATYTKADAEAMLKACRSLRKK